MMTRIHLQHKNILSILKADFQSNQAPLDLQMTEAPNVTNTETHLATQNKANNSV